MNEPDLPASLLLTKIRPVKPETVEGELMRAPMQKRVPRGSYAPLRKRLIAMTPGSSLAIPFTGEPKVARDLLASITKDLMRTHPGVKFRINRSGKRDVFFVTLLLRSQEP